MPDNAPASASAKRTPEHVELGWSHQDMFLWAVDTARAERAERGIRAWLLAPDIPTYQALMRGEQVPLDRLNGDAVKRYGIRRAA